MVFSISAVPPICVSAPATSHSQNVGLVAGRALCVTSSTPGQEQQRERKAEQEAHMRRADRAQASRQLALHGVAQSLKERGRDGESDPEPTRHYAAFSATTM